MEDLSINKSEEISISTTGLGTDIYIYSLWCSISIYYIVRFSPRTDMMTGRTGWSGTTTTTGDRASRAPTCSLQGELVDNGFGVNVPCEEEKCGNKCVSEVIKALINNISNVKQIGIKSTQAMLNTYPELIDTYSFSRGNSCFQVWHRFYDDNWQGRMVELCTGVSLNNISSTIMTGAPTKAPTGSSPPTTQTQISWYPHQMWNIFIVSVLTRSTASRGSSPGW